jgi:3',5'-cyclic AMP phosphodiesterase CpdA
MIRRTGRQPVVVQLSDPHVGAHWGPGEAAGRLAAAVAAVDALDVRPAAVLVSGDLADHGDDAEYRQAHDLLAALGAPLVVLPGNHDSRGGLRRRFGLPGSGDDPVQYAVALDGLQLVVLDSTRPGEDRGELDR